MIYSQKCIYNEPIKFSDYVENNNINTKKIEECFITDNIIEKFRSYGGYVKKN